MNKILSVSDVITNSSDELFIMKTYGKDPKEYIVNNLNYIKDEIEKMIKMYTEDTYTEQDMECHTCSPTYKHIQQFISYPWDIELQKLIPNYDGTKYFIKDKEWLKNTLNYKVDEMEPKEYCPNRYNNSYANQVPPSIEDFAKDFDAELKKSGAVASMGLQPYNASFMADLFNRENIFYVRGI